MKNTILLSLFMFTSFSVHAAFKGTLAFNEEETKLHLDTILVLVNEADQCLNDNIKRHQEFYKKYGISAFYGQNSAFSKMSQKEKVDFLVSKKLDPKLVNELSATSCVGLALKCLEKGFSVTNQEEAFKRLKAYVVANGVDGTALQDGLSKLGWKTLYWNPNPEKNKTWDLQERLADPRNKKHFRGFHEDNYVAVKNKNRYYMNNVQDATTLINFGSNEPEYLKSIPFFVGTAHMGYHVFPGAHGVVIEAHSTRAITDENTIESAPFNPLDDRGAPSGRYRSGLISVPPTF